MKGFLQFFLFSIIVFHTNFSLAQSRDEKCIRNILAAQASAWNRGSIDGFMQGYWQNDSLMFIENNGINYGWQKASDNYKNG